jgi:hypothetical protein
MSQVCQTLIDDRTGTGTLERACVVGGRASAEKARESKPRDPDHVMKGTGERAENDLQQRTSEAGSASAEKARESKPRDPDHVMKGTGERAENDLQQRAENDSRAEGVLHCMEPADEKLAWRVVSGHCQ